MAMENTSADNAMVRRMLRIFGLILAVLWCCAPTGDDDGGKTDGTDSTIIRSARIDSIVIVTVDTILVVDTVFVNDTVFVHHTFHIWYPDTVIIPGDTIVIELDVIHHTFNVDMMPGIYHGYVIQPPGSTWTEPMLWGCLAELRPTRYGPTREPGILKMKYMMGCTYPNAGPYGIEIRKTDGWPLGQPDDD